MARGGATKTDWTLHVHMAAHDRTDVLRPRRLLMPRSLAQQRRVESSRCAREVLRGAAPLHGGAVHHFEEQRRARWLLSDTEACVPLTTRPNRGLHWQAVGGALCVLGEHPAYRLSPAVANASWDCTDLRSAFPEFSAVGVRPLQHGLVNRLVFELRADPLAKPHIAQLGVARLSDDPTLPLSHAVLWSSAGDVTAKGGQLDVVSLGWQGAGLTPRLEDWCSGAPTWLDGEPFVARLMLEVDLCAGQISLSLGGWSDQPVVLSAPFLKEEDAEYPWYPVVALTGVGHEARLLDFQVRNDV